MPEIPTYTFTWSDGTEETMPFAIPYGTGKRRGRRMAAFAAYIKEFQTWIDFKLSSRGWGYQLEGFKLIDKGQFDRVQDAINDCRKMGYLPIDFVAGDEARSFECVKTPDKIGINEHVANWISALRNSYDYYTPDYWSGEEYYVQMLVEKIDLVSLFKPICDAYHIPIATSKGWSSILQRWEIVERFKKAEENGLKAVLLYCGDHDPYGLAISDYMRKNLMDIYQATDYDADKIEIDRFGLNADFIRDHNLTWIDNLITGSGKGPDYDDPIFVNYIREYGERKCEANALVVVPDAARSLCTEAIEKYYGNDILGRFAQKEEEIRGKVEARLKEIGILETLDKALEESRNEVP